MDQFAGNEFNILRFLCYYIYLYIILFTFRTCVTYILIYVLLKKRFSFFFLKSQKSTKLKIGHATIYKIIIFINHFPKHRSIMLFVNCSWVRNYFIGWFMGNLSIDMYKLKILQFDISSWDVFWCFWFISFSLIILCILFHFWINLILSVADLDFFINALIQTSKMKCPLDSKVLNPST